MHLWTDYEGKTIAGDYPLSKLLRSEGRNAFFAAKSPKGTAAVVRLTEAHFDEREMLNRWSKVVDLKQSSLLGIEKFGETTVDGVTLAYAVLEPNDANLDDVLRERPLTSAETQQVAKNVASALESLHASGLVHEHVDAANVLAVGEDVKLRSDCVRESVADMEFSSAQQCEQARRSDVRDLGALLLRCLTLEKTLKPGTRLPPPFDQIVPRALDGSWSLPQILEALDKSSPVVAAPTPRESPRLVPEKALGKPSGSPPAASVRPAVGPATARIVPEIAGSAALPEAKLEDAPRLRPRTYVPPVEHATVRPRSVWALGIVAAFLILLGWYFLFRSPSKPAGSAATTPAARHSAPAASSAVAGAPRSSEPTAPAKYDAQNAQAGGPADLGSAASAPVASAQPGWRVIAYTYNHQGQAEARATRMNAKHPGLAANVFSPKGRAPFLVVLSGPVTEPQAKEILKRARHAGAPRDTFIRRF